MSAERYRNEKERAAVRWAKASYGRAWKRHLRERLERSRSPWAEKHRYRPYGHQAMNVWHAWAANWFRREYIMRGRS